MVEDAKLREQVRTQNILGGGFDVQPPAQVESYNRRLREFEEQSKARSRHLAGLVSSQHSQFPSHHHLQSDLLLEVSFCQISIIEGWLWNVCDNAVSLFTHLYSLLSTSSLLIGDSDTSQMFAVALSKR